jgi:hypothetical protein
LGKFVEEAAEAHRKISHRFGKKSRADHGYDEITISSERKSASHMQALCTFRREDAEAHGFCILDFEGEE